MASADTTRLHISPLTPELLQSILRLAAIEAATDISYHSVQTFPENDYGFVNLPKMDAEKVVKKLNGTILKGKKLKIHVARPVKRPTPDSEGQLDTTSTLPQSKPDKISNERKITDNIVNGHELPQGRHVKRGWTEPAGQNKRSRNSGKKEEKRKSQSSKYTEKPECLFRTTVPPNRSDVVKDKKKSSEKMKNKDKIDGGVVVHEFENLTTIPSFLRTSGKPKEEGLTSEYVDGKGWVDRAGNVKEKPVMKDRLKAIHLPLESTRAGESKKSMTGKVVPQPLAHVEVDSDETSSSGSSSESSSEEEDSDSEEGEEADSALSSPSSSSGNDSTASSPSSESGEEEEEEEEEEKEKAQSMNKKRVKQTNNTVNTTTHPSITVTLSKDPPDPPATRKGKPAGQVSNPNQSPAAATEVHPLEALFKRPAKGRGSSSSKPPLEINTQFSFFGGGDADDIEEEQDDHAMTTVENNRSYHYLNTGEPQTPFTKQDLMSRTVRSAAPTPDTAAPTRCRFWDDDDVGDKMDVDETEATLATPSKKPAAAGEKKNQEKDASDFAKWFWENRGDNNRAWKRRRREAAKEKRQRENRQKGIRGK
ncbi:hypothetical protein ACJ73_01160 [Blastomyces percursus]|uniref:RRM domain-containing protein n=1 Tax=Blastomyces percursus TaxID=1658174 RepID=A0A1J9R513_9EURO|nr:hypothetical protein ACJ73_01160 [Blastomyces percursus]